jgi:hypothetical protein
VAEDEKDDLRSAIERAHASSEVKAPVHWRGRRHLGRPVIPRRNTFEVESRQKRDREAQHGAQNQKLQPALAAIDRAVKALGPKLHMKAKSRNNQINDWLQKEGLLPPIQGEKSIFVSQRSVRRYFENPRR